METIEVTLYTFEELSDKAKERASDYYMERMISDWWYEPAMDDAKEFYLDIQEFDIYRNYCNAKFIDQPEDTAKAIVEGAVGALLEIARDWQKQVNDLFNSYSDYDKYLEWLREMDYTLDDMEFEDWVLEESGYQDDKESAGNDFLRELEDYYLRFLKDDYDNQTSVEYIADFYTDNDYWFDINGKIHCYEQ